MNQITLICMLFLMSCNLEKPTQFSELALKDSAYALNKESFTIKAVLEKYKGKKIVIDVWASWCGDCIRALPAVRNLQKSYPNVVFLFLSVDTSKTAWKNGVRRFNLQGEHYNLPKGMKDGDFVDFINLGWIPRYMVIDETGKIALFKATSASDSNIEKALNTVL